MSRSVPRVGRRWIVALLAVLWSGAAAAQAVSGWATVDYSALVDTRKLSHSGESIELLLGRLGGRALPPTGERQADRIAHILLDPLLEPYAFVMSDALDALNPVPRPAMVEIGSLWDPAQPQPAWAELLRSRRYVVESDGRGRYRVLAPWSGAGRETPSAAAAAEAWVEAWPVLRRVFAAERRRLGRDDATVEAAALEIAVHAYRHQPERLVFRLGLEPHRVKLEGPGPAADAPPLNLERIEALLRRGVRLEGARLEPGGALRWLESEGGAPPTLLGTPLTLGDFAVAYRAVFHGGLSEPYMSLDRGDSPQTAIVNYGGRLRDTRLGWVSLLCDIRFKTFSLGRDIVEREDLRARIRERIPGFRTHLERFAQDSAAGDVLSQQTRLWFYPQDVDLTVSPQGDVLVMRNIRMTASSERVEEVLISGGNRPDPPWTLETVAAINEHYDTLAAMFPELGDLDTAVRLLSLFTWLRQAGAEGLELPDLDALLDVTLPSTPTPRRLPQLLTFNALPPPGGAGPVEVLDRSTVADALERLNPGSGRPLPAERRFRRALGFLDRRVPDQAALLSELRGYDVSRLTPSALDILAYRAERLRAHRAVFSTLPEADRDRLVERQRRGEALRAFSVAIGGIDLGMGQALRRAAGRSRGLEWGGAAPATPLAGPSASRRARAPRAAGDLAANADAASPPAARSGPSVPAHGPAGSASGHRLRSVPGPFDSGLGEQMEAVYGADGPEPRSRRLVLDENSRATAFERFEDGRLLRFRFARVGERLTAIPRVDAEPAGEPAPGEDAGVAEAAADAARPAPPPGLVLLRLAPDPQPGAETPAAGAVAEASQRIELRIETSARAAEGELSGDLPRGSLQRLILGGDREQAVDAAVERLFAPAAGSGPSTLMFLMHPDQSAPPWTVEPRLRPGEEDPLRVADAFRRLGGEIFDGAERLVAVVGTDRSRSPERWRNAPPAGRKPALLLPADGFPVPSASLRERLRAAWERGAELSGRSKKPGNLVVLVSAEAPALFARRLRALAGDPSMQGKLLAAWCLAGPLRADLPGALLAEGRLAAVGVAHETVVGPERAVEALGAYAAALADPANRERGIAEIRGPFLWYF